MKSSVQTATKANKQSKLSDWIDVSIPAPVMRQYRAMAERCNVPLEIALQVGVSLGLQSKFGIPKRLADQMDVKVY
jgi:hypothetical protein